MANREWPRKVIAGSVIVKVYRVKHATSASGFTYVIASSSAGTRKLQKFAIESDAMAEARLKADQLNAGRVEGAEMSRADRDELQEARKITGSVPVLVALREWSKVVSLTDGNLFAAAEAWAARNSKACDPVTAAEGVKLFLAAKKKQGVDVTASYTKVLPHFEREFRERRLDTLSTRELQVWLDRTFPHPVTRNTVRARLRTLWGWARKQGYLPPGMEQTAEDIEVAREQPAQIGVIDSDTFRRLLEHFRKHHPEYLAALTLAGFCGLRRAEIHTQIWDDVLLDRKFARVTSAKKGTAARRIVPLCEAAIKWLLLCKDRKGPVCENLAIDRIRDIGRAAEFKLPENCFRHSFISHRVAQTGNVAETSLEAGNSPKVIFRHYRELFTKQEGKSWFCIRPSTTACSAEPMGIDRILLANR